MGWVMTELISIVRRAFFHDALPMDGAVGLEGEWGGLPGPIGVEDPVDMGESNGDVSRDRRQPIPEDEIFPSSNGIAVGSPFLLSLAPSAWLDIMPFVIDVTSCIFVPALDTTTEPHLLDRCRPRLTRVMPGRLRKFSFISARTSPTHFLPWWCVKAHLSKANHIETAATPNAVKPVDTVVAVATIPGCRNE